MTFHRVAAIVVLLLLQVFWLDARPAGAQPAPQQETPQRRLARLLLKRAKLRDAQAVPDVDGAISDASEAIGLDPNLASAYVMLSNVHLSKSRHLYSYSQKLDELTLSINASDEAQKRLVRGDDVTRVDLHLVRSFALVERANYVLNETFEPQTKDLHDAIAEAQQAADLQASQPLLASGGSDRPGDYPDLALGNACEDLAWICDEDRPENFRKAITAFKRAGEKGIIARAAQTSIGRCYYRIATQSSFEADEYASEAMRALGIDGYGTALAKAKDELSAAVDFKPSQSDAEQYLASVFALYKDYDAADAHFQAAVDASGDEMTKASNLFTWAASCLSRAPLKAGQAEALADRIAACQAVTGEDWLDPKKMSAYIRAQVKSMQPDIPAALAILNAALARADQAPASEASFGYAYLLDLRGLLHFQQAQVKGASPDEAIRHYDGAIADFEKELKGVTGRVELMQAHRWAALSASMAYLTTLRQSPTQPSIADQKYYARIVYHARALDRIWRRRQSGQIAIVCHAMVAKMFTERAGYMNSPQKLLAKTLLTKADRDLAVEWVNRLVTMESDASRKALRKEEAGKLTAALDQALGP